MHELRQFLCTKVELSNRGGLNLDKCVIISAPYQKPKKPKKKHKHKPKAHVCT